MSRPKCNSEYRCTDKYCPINNDYYVSNHLPEKHQEIVNICYISTYEKQESHVNTYRDYKSRAVLTISCRAASRGGTSVSFYVTSDGLKGIWCNDVCPWEFDEYVDENGVKIPGIFVYGEWNGDHFPGEASDGHNVSKISWTDLKNLVKMAEVEGF